ncbi:2-hydroxy-6-oxo-6-phenylhexa-2,4-dienoate hydrolase [Oceanobacillus oncorhynchi]|uniref:2-hydroxy-6-oxo-6-phenylhexa-2,4-dienoate hydrolase n=1 Tax=Oceanobacillus oncorhynchi TaxID=545501 RepID=A0A0A1MDV0_9BACI|nr:alpha/beta hydrolase [Oceanobacillus oncorhynchi]CEI83550.1 2-hydroxy-6-oxo-6-phenylhexa-2,4-dienoate hydrolase [Oceanobacillus oncorhynchi]
MERILGTYFVNGQTIEYSITGKEGTPILVMHGGHSNCYEEFGYKPLVKSGFMLITPSRAGYGKTSKEIGENLSKASDYYVKLLDYLKIDKVHLLAISAGGPSGLYFATRYPERVKTLTLQSAVTKEWLTPEDKIYKAAQILFRPAMEKATWKLASSLSNIFPEFMFKQMIPSFSNLSYKEIKNSVLAKDIDEIQRMSKRQRSGYGFLIDLSQTKEITSKNLQAISSPTLIMHSEYDGSVPLEHAYYADQQIRDSELCILDTWGHLIWLGRESDKVNERLVKFLNKFTL